MSKFEKFLRVQEGLLVEEVNAKEFLSNYVKDFQALRMKALTFAAQLEHDGDASEWAYELKRSIEKMSAANNNVVYNLSKIKKTLDAKPKDDNPDGPVQGWYLNQEK